MACDHSTQQSYVRLHKIYLNRREGGGGVSQLDSIKNSYKTIARHKLVGTNLAPTEEIYRVLLK